jgi:integrase
MFTGKVSFVERNGKLYARATYRDKDGTRKQLWRTVTGKRSDAKTEVIKEVERIIDGKDDTPRTFADLAEYFKKTRAIPAEFVNDEKVRGTKTYKQTRSVVEALSNFYGNARLEHLTRDAVQKYRLHVLAQPDRRYKATTRSGRSVSSVNQHLRILRAMLNIAKQERWITEVPSFKGLISSAAEARREAYPTEKEFQRILEACGERQRLNHVKAIVLMIADTGARPVELWQLKWTDVDLEKANVTYTSDKGIRRTRRTIPLSERCIVELNAQPRLNPFVFGGIKSIKRAWTSIKQIADVNVDLYSLRHLFATRIDLMPISQNQKQKLMGHTSAAMFGRYAKLTEETVEEVRELLNANPYLPVHESDVVQ